MFRDYYEPLPDREKYLERIGLKGLVPDGTLETLNKIIPAHVRSIPFENLDVHVKNIVPSLKVRDLYDKIIVRERGGWCHELNGLFSSFLSALGYHTYQVVARVLTRGFKTPIGHRGNICVIDDKKYYCDVGFGDRSFMSAIPLDGTQTPYGYYVVMNGDWYEIRFGEQPVVCFADIKFEPMDFVFANQYIATNQEELFKSTMYVSLIEGNARKLFLKDELTLKVDGQTTVLAHAENEEEAMRIIKEHFGIEF
ncbi:MAG: arylamine N-acetyltransferase family protein [Lachnospiraceae bacterium]